MGWDEETFEVKKTVEEDTRKKGKWDKRDNMGRRKSSNKVGQEKGQEDGRKRMAQRSKRRS